MKRLSKFKTAPGPLPAEAAVDSPLAASLNNTVLSREIAKILKKVILQKVIPRLLNSHGLPGAEAERFRASPRASELAELLVATDQAASLALIRELRGDHADAEHWGAKHRFVSLFESAARLLGDMWADDAVSEFDVTLGLQSGHSASGR